MKKRANRWLSLALSLLFLLALFPVGAGADGATHQTSKSTDIPYAVTGGNIYFDAETGTVVSSDESVTEADIPQEINGIKVTAIGDFSFGGTYIRRIVIPEGVVSIGKQAFESCGGLSSVILPSTVTMIDTFSFFRCGGLSSIVLPESLASIGSGAFMDCDRLTDIYYSGSEEEWKAISIGDYVGPLLGATIHFNSSMPDSAAPAPVEESVPAEAPAVSAPVVQVSNQKLAVDGVAVEIDHYNIDGSNYFKLRDLACLLRGTTNAFDVGYDSATRTITLTTGGVYAPLDTDMQLGTDQSATAVVSNQRVTVNGEEAALTAYNIGGSNFFMLRDLAPYLGFDVDYDSATRTALILTK